MEGHIDLSNKIRILEKENKDMLKLIGLMQSEILVGGEYSDAKLNLASQITGLSTGRITEIIEKSKRTLK